MKINQLALGLVMAGLIGGNAYAANTEMNAAQKKEIQTVVREYLIQNPEVVVASLQAYQQKEMQQAKKNMQDTQNNAAKFADALFHQAVDPMAGNPKGKITVVQFFDYQCPHCIDMVPVMDALLKQNNEVRVVFKEFPIRGPMSEFAARAALAAKEQGKYVEFHHALMESKTQPLTQDAIMQLAKSVGLNVEKLKTDMNSPAVTQQIKDTYKLARSLQLMGTPAFFVAASGVTKNSPATEVVFIPGQVNQDQLKEVIQKVTR